MTRVEDVLEFTVIKKQLESYALTNNAKALAESLEPYMSESEVLVKLKETSEAKLILEKFGNPPLTSYQGMEECMETAKIGGCLSAEQLEQVSMILTTISRLKDFLNRCKQLPISLPYYVENLDSLDEVRKEINEKIRGGKVDDCATKTLKSLRNELERLDLKMRERAEAVLRSNRAYMADSYCTIRNGRICLPVKKEYKAKVSGSVIDESSTGNTFFIEPSVVSKLSEERYYVKLEEENEVRTILYTLTGLIADRYDTFTCNQAMIEKLDFIFAKGKLSVSYNGVEPHITGERMIKIKNGRHPLMHQDSCVPLDFEIGEDVKGIIITGPNTGGKTVAIKTVGLNCYMAQCGLHVACEKASISLSNQILCDIGDGQNITENLSTFSAHIKNVLSILQMADKDSLIIMDELGSGTDPTEGMGIAIAILEELKKSGALYLITTHYPEVKAYAETTQGVTNARMIFDKETLQPCYKLEIGKAGESCAFYIAKKLGMPGSMLQKASLAAYGKELNDLNYDASEEIKHELTAKLKKRNTKTQAKQNIDKYKLGDCVMVYPDKKIGIVCQRMNEKGVLRVQLQNKKIWINHKRVKLHVSADKLYPEDYDFSIIFDSVEERKARHIMERKYDASVEIRTTI